MVYRVAGACGRAPAFFHLNTNHMLFNIWWIGATIVLMFFIILAYIGWRKGQDLDKDIAAALLGMALLWPLVAVFLIIYGIVELWREAKTKKWGKKISNWWSKPLIKGKEPRVK